MIKVIVPKIIGVDENCCLRSNLSEFGIFFVNKMYVSVNGFFFT